MPWKRVTKSMSAGSFMGMNPKHLMPNSDQPLASVPPLMRYGTETAWGS